MVSFVRFVLTFVLGANNLNWTLGETMHQKVHLSSIDQITHDTNIYFSQKKSCFEASLVYTTLCQCNLTLDCHRPASKGFFTFPLTLTWNS